MFSTNTRFFSLIFWETGPSMRKYRLRSTFCSGRWSILIPEKNLKNRDLKISKISNIDEVDIIYIACPRGLSGGKTEPPDDILMFCSANVLSITYKINFGDFCPPFLKNTIFESSTKFKPSQATLSGTLKYLFLNFREISLNNRFFSLVFWETGPSL